MRDIRDFDELIRRVQNGFAENQAYSAEKDQKEYDAVIDDMLAVEASQREARRRLEDSATAKAIPRSQSTQDPFLAGVWEGIERTMREEKSAEEQLEEEQMRKLEEKYAAMMGRV